MSVGTPPLSDISPWFGVIYFVQYDSWTWLHIPSAFLWSALCVRVWSDMLCHLALLYTLTSYSYGCSGSDCQPLNFDNSFLFKFVYAYLFRARCLFFPNLAVGQPSNNMDLSEIEIYLGIMIIFSFCICNGKKIAVKTLIICILTICFTIAVSVACFHIIHHMCSCLEVVLFLPVHFWRHREQDYISKDKNVWK